MWLMTPHGFVSIVKKGGDEAFEYVARTRDLASIEHVCNLLGIVTTDSIIENQGTDYPFRVYLTKAEVSQYALLSVEDINYSNFKDAAVGARGKDDGYANFLMDVWKAGLDLEPDNWFDRYVRERYGEYEEEDPDTEEGTNNG